MRRWIDADKAMDELGRLATDTDLCKRYGNCTPWIPYSAVRKLISDMILEAKGSCDDAVSKEAVLSMIDTYMNKSVELHYLPTSDGIKKLISILPSAQPERPRGHWVEIGDEPYDEWECDVCGFVIDGSGCIDPEEYRDVYRFCPNCGADMIGEQDG